MHALGWPPPVRSDRPTIVLVHGLGVSSRYMIPTGDRLAEKFPVFAPDLPGFGRSPAPRRALSIAEHGHALESWLIATGVDRALLVGHSYGCQVVAELAARRPDRLRGMVLAAPTVEAGRRSIVGECLRLARDIPLERMALVPVVTTDYLRAGLRRVLATLRGAIVDRIETRLLGAAMPTLLIRGSRDPIVSHDWLEFLQSQMRHAEIASIEGAGHAVNFSAARQFAELIERFAATL
jgi:pimeloyl-ACP methyl ester carboxylesterase